LPASPPKSPLLSPSPGRKEATKRDADAAGLETDSMKIQKMEDGKVSFKMQTTSAAGSTLKFLFLCHTKFTLQQTNFAFTNFHFKFCYNK